MSSYILYLPEVTCKWTDLYHKLKELFSTPHPLSGLVDVEIENTKGFNFMLDAIFIIHKQLLVTHFENSNHCTFTAGWWKNIVKLTKACFTWTHFNVGKNISNCIFRTAINKTRYNLTHFLTDSTLIYHNICIATGDVIIGIQWQVYSAISIGK